MKRCLLVRTITGDSGTFGHLITPSGKEYVTGELPWRKNKKDLSHVPTGVYTVPWMFSPAHGRNLFQLLNVPGHTGVEMHVGNFCGDVTKGFKSDVKGCLVLGLEKGQIDGQDAVLDSGKAMYEFEDDMDNQTFELEIREEYE